MALFKSVLLSTATGSIGGMTFSKNKGGAYIKIRSSPTNPNTTFQQAIRTFMAQLSNLWSTLLTQADRDKWEDYAANVPVTNRQGDQIFLTGMNMYVRSNVPRLQASLARQDGGPAIFNLGSFTEITNVAVAATDGVTIGFENTDDWANMTGSAMLIWLARPQQNTINFFKGPYQFAGSILGDDTTPPSSPATLTNPFAFEVGQKIFGRVRVTDTDGRLSADSRFESIAV